MRTTYMTYSGIFIVFYLALIFGLAGCQRDGTAETAGQSTDIAAQRTGEPIDRTGEATSWNADDRTGEATSRNAENVGEYMDDAAITARVKDEFMRDSLLSMSQIEVTTTNGVVELSGTVDSQESIDRAMEIARNVKNVNSVNNALVF